MTPPDSASAHPCPECGKPLPAATADTPRPVCPACLLAQALASGTAFDPASPTPANPPPPPPTPEQIGDKFPQFEILSCLGRGGMGVVYKARQKSLNRLVAIKILAPERERDARFAERFAREAELLARLSHPHIVTIHDFGETADLFYIVMEFVDGVNLRDLIRDGKLEATQALAIVPPICEALQYAHEKGVVHRDIKPENLLLDREGRVKIADFGIAALVGSGDGERAGTPPYMAPEQSGPAPGAPGAPNTPATAVDHRADIYALGVVLYEMLTGERPARDVVAPSRKVQIDVRLDEIVLRALEKTPSLRYQTAGEFRTRVQTMTAPASTPAPAKAPPPPGTPRPDDVTPSVSVSPSSRLSRTAFAGAAWAGFSAVLAIRILALKSVGPAAFTFYGALIPGRWFILWFGLTAPIGATALGWIAVTKIRRSAGRLHGLGLAVFAGLFFPLLALDASVAWTLVPQILQAYESGGPAEGPRPSPLIPIILRLFAIAALLLGNALFVRALWSRLAGMRPPGRLFAWSGLAIAVAILITGLCRRFPPPRHATAVAASLLSHDNLLSRETVTLLAAQRTAWLLQPYRLRPVPDGPWVAQLPDDGLIELLAVRLHPSTGQPWLRPDGSLADYDPAITRSSTAELGDSVIALVRIRLPGWKKRWPNPDGSPRHASVSLQTGASAAILDGHPLPREEFELIELPATSISSIIGPETTLRLGVATAEWQTLATQKPGWWANLTADPARREWTFSETPAGGLQVTITHLATSPNREYRLVALDDEGVEHTAPHTTFAHVNTEPSGTYVASFDGTNGGPPLPLRRVREVRRIARSYEFVEFRHVSLRPGHRTTVEIKDFARQEPPAAPVPASP